MGLGRQSQADLFRGLHKLPLSQCLDYIVRPPVSGGRGEKNQTVQMEKTIYLSRDYFEKVLKHGEQCK